MSTDISPVMVERRPGGIGWMPSVSAGPAQILQNKPVNDEYRHMVLRCATAIMTDAAPGQFFQILCPHTEAAQPFLRRPMSLFGVDRSEGTIEFLYKVTGIGTRGLASLKRGDTVDIMGPLGVGFSLGPELKSIVAVGRGAGLATLAPLAEAARQKGIAVTAVLSARHPDLVVSADVFERHGASVISVTDYERTSGPANVERLLRGLIAEHRCDAFFTCGSSRLLRVQQRLSREFGILGQVAMEQQMACGLGLCFCCVRDFHVNGEIVQRRVCWDGPVFDLAEALP